jgi:hypothetical protein
LRRLATLHPLYLDPNPDYSTRDTLGRLGRSGTAVGRLQE